MKWLNHAAISLFPNRSMKIIAKYFDGRLSNAEQSAAKSWLARMAARALESVADMKAPRFDSDALNLAELYELGLGVEQDREKAIYWYKQSAQSGLWAAKKRLQELGVDWKPA